MATLTAGYSFGATEQVTNTKLGTLVSSATLSSLVNADVDAAAAIANSKLNLASISQAVALTGGLTLSSNGLTMTSQEISEAKGADVASAATTTIWTGDGNFIHITGTTTITSFGTASQAGLERTIVFDGALTLTHNATTLKLPGGANITTAANDTAIVRADTTANAIVISYKKADGTSVVGATAATALTGSVVQTVNTQTGAVATGTTAIPNDDTIPQNTEGDEYMTLAITPTNASNKLKIQVVWIGTNSNANNFDAVALFQDSTAGALAVAGYDQAGGRLQTTSFVHYMTAGTTSATTFKVRAGGATGSTTTFNGTAGGRKYGGVVASSITIQEIKV